MVATTTGAISREILRTPAEETAGGFDWALVTRLTI